MSGYRIYFLFCAFFSSTCCFGLRIAEDPSNKQAVARNDIPRVLLLGDSTDRIALNYFCESHGKNMQRDIEYGDPAGHWYMGATSCDVENAHLVYLFHPGAGKGKYWHDFDGFGVQSSTTELIIKSDLPRLVDRKFGAQPDLIVLGTGIWELEKWWDHAGRPNITDPSYTYDQISEWCKAEVPQLLGWISEVYPTAQIAFRTAPKLKVPVHPQGITEGSLSKMHNCMLAQLDNGKLYGEDRYSLFDLQKKLDDLRSAKGNDMSEFNKLWHDDLHFKGEASSLYLDSVIKLAKQFQH